ncbi:MAG: hypothetical protein IT208_18150 [Chthonomonadales bacterium]|nr:hypothetical protein [Chthonomonadales bacterium]
MPPQSPRGLVLDTARADEIVTCGVNADHVAWVDAVLGAARDAFAAEQQGADAEATLRRHLRAWVRSHLERDDIGAVADLAARIRRDFDVFVLVGIGGSDLGARTLHDALDAPYRRPMERGPGGPLELYFVGDTFDPKRLHALLDLLESRGALARTCVNVVSKSGETAETISAAMAIRERMERAGIADWRRQFVATTGRSEGSVLHRMNEDKPFYGILPVPEGVGGRFSFASPVGLLPFAVAAREEPAERLERALAGYGEAHEAGLLPADDPRNVAMRLARWWHLGERYAGYRALVLCNYADDARLGDWFTQLYSESVHERGEGLDIIATRGPTGNHSLLNGILRGRHDKLVLMIRWHELGPDITIPSGPGIEGELADFAGLTMSEVQDASCRATVADYLARGVPTALLTVPARDARCLFLLMRTLMDAVAAKGRLQGLALRPDGHPDAAAALTYTQEGVEGYKAGTRANAVRIRNGD